ncbi:unnamed protein product, partial [Phaeothamnion confervicola]
GVVAAAAAAAAGWLGAAAALAWRRRPGNWRGCWAAWPASSAWCSLRWRLTGTRPARPSWPRSSPPSTRTHPPLPGPPFRQRRHRCLRRRRRRRRSKGRVSAPLRRRHCHRRRQPPRPRRNDIGVQGHNFRIPAPP